MAVNATEPASTSTARAEPVNPAVSDGQFRKLDPRFIRVEQIETWIFTAVLAAVLLIGLVVQWFFGWFPAPVQIVLGVAAVGLLVALHFLMARLPMRGYEASSYAISDRSVEIRRGIWWKHVINVPRSRIQHIDVAQGPLARRYGIGKLVLFTAGTEHSSVELDGLAHETALAIREFLLRGGGSDGV